MSPTPIAYKNRANAEHSTGPRTPEGKKRSSLNALRHGLTSKVVVLPNEDPREYRRHADAFLDEYDPQGSTETQLVQSLIDTSWRLNRILALETKILSGDSELESQTKMLANLSLYSQRLSRQFEKTLAQLRELQQEEPTPRPPAPHLASFFQIHSPRPRNHPNKPPPQPPSAEILLSCGTGCSCGAANPGGSRPFRRLFSVGHSRAPRQPRLR